jgi:hypothetical protein
MVSWGHQSQRLLLAFPIALVASGWLGCEEEQETPRSIEVHDLDYLGRRFFFLVDPVDPRLTGQLLRLDQGGVPPPVITQLQVWRDNRIQADNGTSVPGIAYLDPRPGVAAADTIEANFDALRETGDYTIRNDLYVVNVLMPGQTVTTRFYYPVLDMLSPIGSGEVLAATFTATYTLPGGGSEVIRYGTTIVQGEPPSLIQAKALYIPDGEYTILSGNHYSRQDYWYPIRRLELRNIYGLGATDIDLGRLMLSVKRGDSGLTHFPGAGPDTTYLRALGLDKEADGTPGFDHRVDPIFVDAARGLLMLPDLKPFAPAAEDSVWPFFVADLPNGRPRFFVGEDANANPHDVSQSFYDKRPLQINQSEDRKYLFAIVE